MKSGDNISLLQGLTSNTIAYMYRKLKFPANNFVVVDGELSTKTCIVKNKIN